MASLITRVSAVLVVIKGALGTTNTNVTNVTNRVTTLEGFKGVLGFCGGKPTASENVVAGIAPYGFTITQANCKAYAEVAATASTVFQVKRKRAGVVVNICTLTFAAAGTSATVGSVSNGTIQEDDIIIITAPASPDATCADISFKIKA